ILGNCVTTLTSASAFPLGRAREAAIRPRIRVKHKKRMKVEQRLTRLQQEHGDALPFRRIEGDWATGVLILCDHAANLIPSDYGTLGLAPEDLARHIAYDIGAAAVAEHLARALRAPALLTRYSRLLIDP